MAHSSQGLDRHIGERDLRAALTKSRNARCDPFHDRLYRLFVPQIVAHIGHKGDRC